MALRTSVGREEEDVVSDLLTPAARPIHVEGRIVSITETKQRK